MRLHAARRVRLFALGARGRRLKATAATPISCALGSACRGMRLRHVGGQRDLAREAANSKAAASLFS